MTSPASAASTPERSRGLRTGFTLIEVLVAIGLLVVLASILIPLVVRAQRQAVKSRMLADMQSIGSALEAYRADYGDYPRVTVSETGAAVLGKALLALGPATDPISPYSARIYQAGEVASSGVVSYVCLRTRLDGAVTPAVPDVNWWAPFSTGDGADGAGFRLRTGASIKKPYLQADRFKVSGTDIVDSFGNPILYFPASTAKKSITRITDAGYVSAIGDVDADATALYDSNDNLIPFRAQTPTVEADSINAHKRLRAMLGDIDMNGRINLLGTKQEQPVTQAPFLLWSAGRDGIFGPLTILSAVATESEFAQQSSYCDKCDDVMSFR